jgi:DNA-binding HxlR family transcriptional regulator
MSDSNDKSLKIFSYLKHSVRQKIVRSLSDGPKSYSELLREFKIESSHLNYHIERLNDLLHKTEDGKYALSDLGQTALSMMNDAKENHVLSKFNNTRSSLVSPEKNKKTKLRLGKHAIPAPLVASLLIIMISLGALGYYLYSSFTVPTSIKEPIEIVNYPSQWNLYPGENDSFTVTINNHAPSNYTVVMDISSNDTMYLTLYLTFDNQNYTVVPGQQDLTSWLAVSPEAPAANLSITVTVSRNLNGLLTNGDFEAGSFLGWSVTGVCSITTDMIHSGKYSAYIESASWDSKITQNVDSAQHLTLNDTIYLDGWIYPTKTGYLGDLEYPYSDIVLRFYNQSTGQQEAYQISYEWSATSLHQSYPYITFLSMTPMQWNHFSLNITSDFQRIYQGIGNYQDIYLHSIEFWYHWSHSDPGAFYVDGVTLST